MVATKTDPETRTTFGVGEDGDAQFTISSSHSHAVCAGFSFGQSEKARSIGYQEEISPTLRGGEGGNQKPCALCIGNGQVNQIAMSEQANTLDTMHDQQAVMVLNDQGGSVMDVSNESTATLRAQSHGHEPAVMNQSVVRRMTPLECERLQGYPDGWTDIGEWVDSKGKKHNPADSPRYKALGNSIALPFWFWLLRRISAQYYQPATLGSLFDGIGGFPLCWERCNGKGTALWASEIEEFPMAVTKERFK
jgi:DNA (cytosine-5)-methyltransferase 1